MNTENFVTYEQALTLKELGFREECLYFYADEKLVPASVSINEDDVMGEINIDVNTLLELPKANDINEPLLKDTICDAPTLAQVQDWLRNNYSLHLVTIPRALKLWSFMIFDCTKYEIIFASGPESPYLYEDAVSIGITKCIEIVKLKMGID